MIKICDKAILEPLPIICKNCIDTGIFPDSWKKSNIVPVHKKGDKQLLDNYRPVSLLPILGKVFEKILYNNIFEYLQENNLLCENQFGFRPSDSCEYQLLSIAHEIYASFDYNHPLDVRAVFLDIPKTFDRVWHDRLIYKMKLLGITGQPLKLIQSFLSDRLQRVVLNGQNSSWTSVFAGVPQVSVLGSLFFLIYINDLAEDISSTTKLFADDTSLFSVVSSINESANQVNMGLEKISLWAYQWEMSFNPDIKTGSGSYFHKEKYNVAHPVLYFNRAPVICCSYQKKLGVYLGKKLSFHQHITEIITKASKGVGVIKKLNNVLPRKALLTICKSFVRFHVDYGDILYHQPYNESINSKLESIQYNATLAIIGVMKGTSRLKLYKELRLESLKS